ncbi:hypothetical protein JZ751_013699 [Albula glossodonta]|uniref:Chemokine interleukin-8-like domain-containing protein n=1 Tax=Albula glossodonta TaxID=121402 RepID=A0A8T2NRJ6_9TELE|nr:hypothetical protein JZ751_013699 [Albula glossodonta]
MAQFNLSTACLLLLLSVSLYSVLTESGIFLTVKGKQVCANPTDPWVIERINKLGSKVKKMNIPAQ